MAFPDNRCNPDLEHRALAQIQAALMSILNQAHRQGQQKYLQIPSWLCLNQSWIRGREQAVP